MSKKYIKAIKMRAYWLPALQITMVLIAVLITLALFKAEAAASMLVGGLVSVIPTLYFTWRLFRRVGARAAKKIVKTFYISELIKLVLMGILFVLIVKLDIVIIVPFILGFVIAQMGALVAPLLYTIDSYHSK